ATDRHERGGFGYRGRRHRRARILRAPTRRLRGRLASANRVRSQGARGRQNALRLPRRESRARACARYRRTGRRQPQTVAEPAHAGRPGDAVARSAAAPQRRRASSGVSFVRPAASTATPPAPISRVQAHAMNIDEIIDNFAVLDDWDDRYRYVIELGRELE